MNWKFWEERADGVIDWRLALYGGLKQFAFILAAGLLVKFFVCDSLKIEGAQMEPAIMPGDRILIYKAPYKIPFFKNAAAYAERAVAVTLADKSAVSVLRVAAVSGDTVSIYGGQFYRNGIAEEKFYKDAEVYGVIPADYSPSDFMNAIRIPAPNDTVTFGELDIRDIIFAYGVFRQEVSGTDIKARVTVGDSVMRDYLIRDFALFQGEFDSIPKEKYADWFFWDRLQSYLEMKTPEGQTFPRLAFTVWKGGKEVQGFKVKNRYVFLLGDNWSGARDSRHFGPLSRSNIQGRPVATLWGYSEDDSGQRRKFDGKRVGKFLE